MYIIVVEILINYLDIISIFEYTVRIKLYRDKIPRSYLINR
jgi:hypothetical protein